jgi:formylglycine-generating enzyme required for sulfatase activity
MRRVLVAWGAVAVLAVTAGWLVARPEGSHGQCGPGFAPSGSRCLPGDTCSPPLAREGARCVAPAVRVAIPKTELMVGPSDWEAEGKVAPRTVIAGPFWIDAFEVTEASFSVDGRGDPLVPARAMTRGEAEAYCRAHAGRLPTEDEWMVAAAGKGGTRYPWGDTGAVCRRAAFGLAKGPCASDGVGPDTVGAHATGDTPLGVHDLAGNVAEWVAEGSHAAGKGVAKGGSWRSELATELRVWARIAIDSDAHDDRVGFRCAHDAP